MTALTPCHPGRHISLTLQVVRSNRYEAYAVRRIYMQPSTAYATVPQPDVIMGAIVNGGRIESRPKANLDVSLPGPFEAFILCNLPTARPERSELLYAAN